MRHFRVLTFILILSLSLLLLNGCSSSTQTTQDITPAENDSVSVIEDTTAEDSSEEDFENYKAFLQDFIHERMDLRDDLEDEFLNRLLDAGIYEMSGEEGSELLKEELIIASVRYNAPVGHPDIMYRDAFDYFFVSPEWSAFEGTQNGSSTMYQVAQFEGQCTYRDAPAKVLIQFMLDDNGELQDMYFSVDDIPKDRNELNALLDVVFEQYSLASKKASPSN